MTAIQDFLKNVTDIARQKNSWGQVNDFLKSSELTDFCKSINVSRTTVVTVTLNVVEELQKKKWLREESAKDPSSIEISTDQEEVIQYITGAILFKLKKRYTRQKKTRSLEELDVLIDSAKTVEYRLIKVKSRGGLIYPDRDLLPLMYMGYKICVAGLKAAEIYTDEVLHQARVDESELCCVDLDVLKDILKLLHKILCHHQCDLFLEKMKIKKRCTGKGKGLRSKLVDKRTL